MNLPMVFLHGWGQSSRIWYNQIDHFSRLTSVRTIELPGHGGAPDAPSESWLDTLSAQLPRQLSILVGWSLGGMLSMQLAAAFPERVAGLALVSTTPCFHERPNWSYGCDEATFHAFEQAVANGPQTDLPKSLGRFFALMLHGDDLPRSRFNELARNGIDRGYPPSAEGLKHGLSLLAELDLREHLSGLKQPAWVIHGEKDTIVPQAAGQYLAAHIPHATWRCFENCGHAPFLTEAETFNGELEAWCRNI